jgi:uncharacterized membrane protein
VVDDGQSGKVTLEAAQPTRSIFRPLRLMMIIFILLAAAAVGFYFKSQANPGTEPSSFSSQPPQYINVFETNAGIPVAVTVTLEQFTYLSPIKLQPEGFTDFTEEVSVTASPARSASPGIIMITSSVAPQLNPGKKPTPVENRTGPEKFVAQVPLIQDPGGTWSGIVDFGSIPIIFGSKGSVFAHLPSVGALEHPEGDPPSLFAEYNGTTGQLREATIQPFLNPLSNANMFDPSSYVTIPGDHGELFYGPGNISYTETLHNIVPVLGNQQIDYVVPSMNISGDIDYVWNSTGCCGLEPIFKEINPDAVDSQSQAAFYSGIAFGVAGGAAMALVQEIPEQRKRKSSASGGMSSAS